MAEERGEAAPPMSAGARRPAADAEEPRATTRPTGRTGETPEKEAGDARVAAADTPAEKAGAAEAHPDGGSEYGRRRERETATGTDTPAGDEPGTSGQGPGDGKV
jgi:NADH-quinone oxidoreductase subunit E